jgi:hypothetical protein
VHPVILVHSVGMNTSYAPRTRVGLLISCSDFGVLAASAVVPGFQDVVDPVMGVGFVLAVVTIVYVPRLIRPGSTWLRASMSRPLATSVFVGAGILAMTAAAVRSPDGAIPLGSAATAAIILGMFLVALAAPARERADARAKRHDVVPGPRP